MALCSNCRRLFVEFRQRRLGLVWRQTFSSDQRETTFYEILGVDRTATTQQIKSAYYGLSKIHHPDRQRDQRRKDESARKFQQIGTAYETLGNKEKKVAYDRQLLIGHPSTSNPADVDEEQAEDDEVLNDLRRYDRIRRTYRHRGRDFRTAAEFDAYYKNIQREYEELKRHEKMTSRRFEHLKNEPPGVFRFHEFGRPLNSYEYTEYQKEMIRQKSAAHFDPKYPDVAALARVCMVILLMSAFVCLLI